MPYTWCIYHVKNCIHAKPVPKNKLTVIICKDLNWMGFLINSEIHPFILERPDLFSSQVKIMAKDYGCLKHDSYIDCIKPFPFSDAELSEERDSINIITKAQIKKAVSKSKTIEIYLQKLILKNC